MQSQQALGMGFIAIITLPFAWYVQQDIALSNFTQQQELLKREQIAVMKEQQMRNILDLQQDGIVIFSSDSETKGTNSNKSEVEVDQDAELVSPNI